MISSPFSTPKDFAGALHPQNQGEALWFVFQGGNGLLLTSADGKELPKAPPQLQRNLYLGELSGVQMFAGEVTHQDSLPSGWAWSHLRSLFGVLSDDYFAIAGRAMQLLEWDRSHHYCGQCGSATAPMKNDRCRECTSCGYLAFPKLAPAIAALVKREDKILLARGPLFPENIYSILAGFVDLGETLEQCVAREVFEEVGVTVKNIRYFGSQSWPFSHSLMIGFTCEWESGEICTDPAEIAEAGWFSSEHFPQLPPPLSLSRIMIDACQS